MSDNERLAQHALVILDDEAVKEAFARIEKNSFEAILLCAHDDDAGRSAHVNMIKAVRALKSELSMFITLAKAEAKAKARQV